MEDGRRATLNERILRAKEIILYSLQNPDDKNCFNFDRPYLYSNEGDFYKYLDLKGKSVI